MFLHLKNAGFSEDHSEAITTVINGIGHPSDMATKADLRELRYEIQFEMKCLEQRMTHKMGAIIVGTAAVMMFLDKYLLSL